MDINKEIVIVKKNDGLYAATSSNQIRILEDALERVSDGSYIVFNGMNTELLERFINRATCLRADITSMSQCESILYIYIERPYTARLSVVNGFISSVNNRVPLSLKSGDIFVDISLNKELDGDMIIYRNYTKVGTIKDITTFGMYSGVASLSNNHYYNELERYLYISPSEKYIVCDGKHQSDVLAFIMKTLSSSEWGVNSFSIEESGDIIVSYGKNQNSTIDFKVGDILLLRYPYLLIRYRGYSVLDIEQNREAKLLGVIVNDMKDMCCTRFMRPHTPINYTRSFASVNKEFKSAVQELRKISESRNIPIVTAEQKPVKSKLVEQEIVLTGIESAIKILSALGEYYKVTDFVYTGGDRPIFSISYTKQDESITKSLSFGDRFCVVDGEIMFIKVLKTRNRERSS